MIVTHQHALSKRLYSFIGVVGNMAQYRGDDGAVLCCPLNGGMMMPHGERAAPDPKVIECKREFWRASFKKFDAMMFWKGEKINLAKARA